MQRWNGWGDDGIAHVLGEEALAFLRERLGPGSGIADATFEAACAAVPVTRLAPHPLIDTTPATRVRNALGQSLPDWLKLRHGRIGAVPDGVAFPDSAQQVRQLLDYARRACAAVIPHGGGTSVAGHLTVAAGPRPVLSINLTRLCALGHLDREAQLATFGAGVYGPDLEAQLRAHGYTLGHYPQSFEYSTLGGGPAIAALWPHRAAVRGRRGGNAVRYPDHPHLSRFGGRHRPARNGAGVRGTAGHRDAGDRAHFRAAAA